MEENFEKKDYEETLYEKKTEQHGDSCGELVNIYIIGNKLMM